MSQGSPPDTTPAATIVASKKSTTAMTRKSREAVTVIAPHLPGGPQMKSCDHRLSQSLTLTASLIVSMWLRPATTNSRYVLGAPDSMDGGGRGEGKRL